MTATAFDGVGDELRARALLPSRVLALFVGGSLARGWGHANSDLDLFVVTDQPWRSSTASANPVSLRPVTVATETCYVDGRRWETRYWQDTQVDQMFDKVSPDGFPDGDAWRTLTAAELIFLERLSHAVAVEGGDWLRHRREQLEQSALRAIVVNTALLRAEASVEDAVGLLESGDLDSAVLAAQVAFDAAVDALVASSGELGREAKWRAHRVRIVESPLISFDRYWEIKTMQTFDPALPQRWVAEVTRLCGRIAQDTSI